MKLRVLAGRFYFWLIGWQLVGNLPTGLTRAVIIAAPHTSNRDYLIGVFGFWQRGLHPNILIKAEAFRGVQGWVLRRLGAIPVERGKAAHLVGKLAWEINRRPTARVVFTPEGTRKLAPRWKTGFYFTALAANVPIVAVFTDYGSKTGGFGPVFYPSGDVEKDFGVIRDWFNRQQFTGKYPGQSSVALYPGTDDQARADAIFANRPSDYSLQQGATFRAGTSVERL